MKIIYGDSLVTLADSLYITATSMSIVFGLLVVLCISLYLLRIIAKIGGKEEVTTVTKQSPKKVSAPAVAPVTQKTYQFENLKDRLDDEKIRLAIITSCIHAAEEFGHNNIKINYVREI